jgi:hypothetical protein
MVLSLQNKDVMGIPSVLEVLNHPAVSGVRLRCGNRQLIPSGSPAI